MGDERGENSRSSKSHITHTDRDAIPGMLKNRVYYPNVDHLIFANELGHVDEEAERDADLEAFMTAEGSSVATSKREQLTEREAVFKVSERMLMPCVTHVIFVKNQALQQKLAYDLGALATRAVIFANGRKELVEPGLQGKILNNAARGVPVVCLHHTGGAAELFGDALKDRENKQSTGKRTKDTPGKYRLPDNINADSCLVLDSSKDSVEKVIDKLTLVLSSVQDDEMREVGNSKSEKERLLMAWALYSTFALNAKIQHRRATFLHFLLSFLNVAATVLAVFHMVLLVEYQGSDFEVEYSGTVMTLLPVMPILSGLVMTISGKFSPILKWATLRSGAEQIKTEIYLYRARVGDYTPRVRNSIDIMAKIEKMEDKRKEEDYQALREQRGMGAIPEGMFGDMAPGGKHSVHEVAAKLEPRRTTFAAKIKSINAAGVSSKQARLFPRMLRFLGSSQP